MPKLRITELITFCHELDLLEAHLEEHKHFVDRIIIRESPVTYSYIEKPLYFKENESRFSKYNIEYELVPADVMTPMPFSYPPEEQKKWKDARRHNRETSKTYRWDKIRRHADFMFVMDCDEFIDQNRYHFMEEALQLRPEFVTLKLQSGHFFMNGRASKKEEYRICRGDQSTHYRRRGSIRGSTEDLIGWHFTNCFLTPEDYRLKGLGIAQSICNGGPEAIPDEATIADRLAARKEVFSNTPLNFAEILSYTDLRWAPVYVQEHPERFPWYKDLTYLNNSGRGVIESEFTQPQLQYHEES